MAPLATLRPRSAPIVWPTRNGPLTPDDIRFYESNGYLFWPAYLSEHAPKLLCDCIQAATHLENIVDKSSFIWESRASRLPRSIYSGHRLSPAFDALMRFESFVQASSQLLGSAVYLHQSHLNYKKAFLGEGFYWHQDFSYWHYEDGMPQPRAIGLVVFLDTVTHMNGPLMIIPGSHRWLDSRPFPDRCDEPNASARHTIDSTFAANGLLDVDQLRFLLRESEIVPVTGPAGSVLMYDCVLAHASSENLSNCDRRMMLLFYNSMENTLTDPKRPTYIAEQSALPLN